jgi:hypothetical protein
MTHTMSMSERIKPIDILNNIKKQIKLLNDDSNEFRESIEIANKIMKNMNCFLIQNNHLLDCNT